MHRYIVIGLILANIFGSHHVLGKRRSESVVKSKVDHEFIDKVHELSSDIGKETVIEGNQVVWSPYSVVSVLSLNGDNLYKDSFNSSLNYLRSIEGLSLKRVSVVFTNRTVNGSDYETKVVPLPADDNSIDQLVKDTYKNETGLDAPHNLIQGSLENATEVYLTNLGVAVNWEVPFHYGNSRTNRFYINSTHAIKTRYLVNVGYYKYADIEDLDARVVAIPLKDAPTTFFVVVLPNSHDGLQQTSFELGKRNVSDLFDELKTRRVYLRLPKIDIENQLLFSKNNTKIIQYASLQLTYSGVENNHIKLNQQRIKFKQLKKRGGINFRVENPFIFMIYETVKGGILNYGEVMIPAERPSKPSFKYQQNHLSQNGKILSEAIDKLGDDLYTSIKKRTEGSFVFSPLSLTNLIGSVLSGAAEETKTGILSKLNFPLMWQDALVEINQQGKINGSTSRVNVVVNGEPKESFREEVGKFGTNVVSRQARDFTLNYTLKSVIASSEYEINPHLVGESRTVEAKFYRNEVDTDNITYLEFYTPGFKYLYVPFWDAKIVSIPLNDGQNQSLLLVVPGERSGLSAVEDGIVDYPISKLLCQGHVRRAGVRVRLPLLALEHITDFTQDLKNLDMPQFESGDFSGIVDNGKLDRLVQRAVFKLKQDSNVTVESDTVVKSTSVNATTTEKVVDVSVNANATSSTTTQSPVSTTEKVTKKSKRSSKHRNSYRPKGSAKDRSKLVKIDRPFVFYVQDARVGTVLVGRYVGAEAVPLK